jgi:hypothetical protein
MKKSKLFLLAFLLAIGWIGQGETAVVMVGGPGVVLGYQQPVQAVIVDTNGNTYQQTVYYNPSIGGVDLDTSYAGPNASVYFPEYGTGYVWYNGYWVDQAGYYWDGGRRLYIGHPHWHDHWALYWGGHDHWHGGWHSHPEVSVHVHETIHNSWHHHHR